MAFQHYSYRKTIGVSLASSGFGRLVWTLPWCGAGIHACGALYGMGMVYPQISSTERSRYTTRAQLVFIL
jgi:hypothetical protein